MTLPPWLELRRGEAPLLVSIPHTGQDLAGLEPRLVSSWLARKDADWWIETLYDFAAGLGASVIRTAVSRTVIDVNRDPSGRSLYPGQATTELCPTTTFDGEPLYRDGAAPDAEEIATRRRTYFDPYHAALHAEVARLRAVHPRVVVYDCHSIRSIVPRLFDGVLPVFNLGTNGGTSADPSLVARVRDLMAGTGQPFVVDGRFKGGWITRSNGRPAAGVHALQMELACRGYMADPDPIEEAAWPVPYDPVGADRTRTTLVAILSAALAWARA